MSTLVTPVTTADIAAACGVAERTVRNWTQRPGWPAGKRMGKGGALTWELDQLPKSIVLRGRVVKIKVRTASRQVIRAVKVIKPELNEFFMVIDGEIFEVKKA